MMVNEDTHALRRDVDKLMNKLVGIEGLEENIIATVEKRLLERDHPVGSPYFTFIVSDNPNNRFPGTTWERIEENTSLITAGDGINALDEIGSNSQGVRIDWQHTHVQNAHTHTQNAHNHTQNAHNHSMTFDTWSQAGTNRLTPRTTGDTISSANMTSVAPSINNTTAVNQNTIATNQNSGAMTSATQYFDNRSKSVAIYMWRRIA